MPFRLPRIPRPVAVTAAAVLAVAGVSFSASAAQAETRSGDVTVSLPSKIVLDGSAIPVTVSSDALTGYFDKVYVWLYNGTEMQGIDEVEPNKSVSLSSALVKPGSIIARGSAATTYCSVYSSYPCSLDSDFRWYQPVSGLSYPDSAPATAKWASRISLVATNDGTRTTWTITAQRYGGYSWIPWNGAAISIGSSTVSTDATGIATWLESTSELHTLTAVAQDSADVWGSSSAAATAVLHLAPVASSPVSQPTPPPTSTKPGHVTSSASATKTATAMKKGLTKVRKVVTLTKKNDVNKLLGKKDGYTSAAVLYDKRTSCSDGPGVDCGATIEKFTSTAKAKARAKHIQKLLKKYSFLGTEYDTVHRHFLLRVSGDLTRSQAATYKRTFAKVF